MSTSPARLAANAANAALSTGPRTPDGKARSARELIIRHDEREEFRELRVSFYRELRPRSVVEQSLFDQFLHAAWNLRRVRRLEAELFDGDIDPLTNDKLDPDRREHLPALASIAAVTKRTQPPVPHGAMKPCLRSLDRHATKDDKKLEAIVTMKGSEPAATSVKLPESVNNWVGDFPPGQVRDTYLELTQKKPRGEIDLGQ